MNATTYGLDVAKRVFQLYWVDAQTGEIANRRFGRDDLIAFLAQRPAGRVALDACGSAHWWARKIQALGHEVVLLHAQFIRPFVQTNKTCVFHTKLDKDFAASWTGFSHEAGHGFHGKLDSDFAPSWTVSSSSSDAGQPWHPRRFRRGVYMAFPKLTMRKIREALRLHFDCGFNHREVARALGTSPTTVGQYVRRLERAGLSYPLPPALGDDELEARLFPPPPRVEGERPTPHWPTVRRELARKGVTLDLLWNEYKAEHPDGYAYTWFCTRYSEWANALPLTLRQTHAPGEKLFVDYSGDKIAIINAQTGEIREAELFVAVLGASNYTYAEATWTQQSSDWIGSHIRTFEFMGGCPEIVTPDNLKSGVHKPSFYDPIINRTYGEMASHYSVAVIPARSKKPRDKAKVEQGVLLVQRYILARLRKHRFFSLTEANSAIATLLVDLNNKAFKKLPGSRRSTFDDFERSSLKALPSQRYQYADWKVARVGPDYHVDIDVHYYSVPHRFARQQVDVRYTNGTVEIFHRGTRIAAHARSTRRGHHSTVNAHMPPHHQEVSGWGPQRLYDWAIRIGPHTAAVIQHLLGGRQHPQQAYRACLGVLRLGKDHGNARLEAACCRAIDLKAPSYRFISSTLKNGLDQSPQTEADQASLPLTHPNVRGPDYYH